MHGLMIATYVLKAQRQNALAGEDFLASEARTYSKARRVLVPLATGLAGMTAAVIALGVFR